MNRIFRTVWNEATQSWVAVSELAKSHTRGSSLSSGGWLNSVKKFFKMTLGALSVILALNINQAYSATVLTGTGTNGSLMISGHNTSPASQASGNASIVIQAGSPSSASAWDGIAIGSAAQAVGPGNASIYNPIAIGTLTYSSGSSSIAFGAKSRSTGDYSLAFGGETTASSKNTIAFGNKTTASDEDAIAIGSQAVANNKITIAIGQNSKATQEYAISLGAHSEANGVTSLALGAGARSQAARAISLGNWAISQAKNAMSLGNNAVAGQEGSISLGYLSKTDAKNTIAIGSEASNTGIEAIAIGYQAKVAPVDATKLASIAIGSNSSATGHDGISLGPHAKTSGWRAHAIGTLAEASGDYSAAWGSATKATSNNAIAIGQNTQVAGVASVALGKDANIAAGATNSYAFGVGAKVLANVSDAIAFGTSAQTNGENGIAIGNGAQANALNTIAIGTGNVVSGVSSGAFGDPNTVSGTGSYAFGNNNTIANNNTFVLGNSVTSSQDNAVILGNNSTDKAHAEHDSVTIDALEFKTFAGTAAGVVSVGRSGADRQVVNVAAGEISANSTDAINGSQLYATNNLLNSVAKTARDVLGAAAGGSGFSLANNGTLSAVNVGGTGKTTVNEAIDFLRTGGIKVNADNNDAKVNPLGATLSVLSGNAANTSTENLNTKVEQDGTGTKITVSLKKAPNFDSISLTDNGGVKTTLTPNANGLTLATGGNDSKLSGIATAMAGDADNVAANKGYVDNAVKNAGWELKGNGATVDAAVVKGDSVDFIHGDGTEAVVTNSGMQSTVKYNVKTAALTNGADGKINSPNVAADKVFATAGNVADVVNTTVDTLNNKGIKINADAGGSQIHKLGNELAIAGGNATGAVSSKNLKTTVAQDGNGKTTVTVAMKDNPSFTTLTVDNGAGNTVTLSSNANGLDVGGNTTVNNQGIHINNGTNSVSLTENGLDNGGNKITNVSAGTAAGDVATIGQLSGITSALGGGASINPSDGSIIAPSYQITLSDGSTTTVHNIGDAISNLNGLSSSPLTFAADQGTNVERRLGSTVNINGDNRNITTTTTTDGVKVALNNTINISGINADGVSIKGGGPTITKNGIDMAGSAITNMSSGLPLKQNSNGDWVPMTAVEIKQAIIDGTLDPATLNKAVNVGDLMTQSNNVLNVSKNIYGQDSGGNPYVRPDGTMSSAGRAALRTYNVDDSGTQENNGIFNAIKNMNEQGIKFFHTNDGVVKSEKDGHSEEDSNANAAYSTAIGYRALATKNAVAGLAVGPASVVDQPYAVALGAESYAGEAHVAAGTADSAYTYGGLNDEQVAAKASKGTRVASIGAEGKERQLQHVAAGVISPTSTDAVNGSQLYYTNKAVENNTRAINQLRGDVHKMDRNLRAGIAGATALSFLQRPVGAGKSLVSIGFGGYRGESAVALGYSRNSDTNKISVKVGAGINTRSDVNFGGSIGYQW